MNKDEIRKYIDQLAQEVSMESVLVITPTGQLQRIRCPFNVIVIKKVPFLEIGDRAVVTSIRISLDLLTVYTVNNKMYFYYNFIILESL